MILVVFIYAGNILTGKAINDLPPLTIAFFRLVIAFIIMFPIGIQTAWKKRSTFLEHKTPLLIMALTGVTFYNIFLYGALQFTSTTNVSVLQTAIPVVTVILSAFLLKERLKRIQWLGILLSFFGAAWVVLDGKLFQLTTNTWNIGDAIMIGAILAWSIYTISVKRYMPLFPQFAAIFVMTGISVVIILPMVLIEWAVVGIPSFEFPSHLIGLLYLGIFPSFIALLLYNHAIKLIGPSQTSVFINFLPVVTMIGAYIWLNENITLMQLIGALLVICGVFLTTQFNRDRKKGVR